MSQWLVFLSLPHTHSISFLKALTQRVRCYSGSPEKEHGACSHIVCSHMVPGRWLPPRFFVKWKAVPPFSLWLKPTGSSSVWGEEDLGKKAGFEPTAANDRLWREATSVHSAYNLFNLWVLTPWGGIARPFHRGHLNPSENIDIYIIMHDSSKISVMKQQWKSFHGWGSQQHKELY